MEFKFPDLGEGVTEGEIKKWLVKEGDRVKKDQSIAEVETDKAVVEMPSPASGRIESLKFPEGGIVKVGETLATIASEEEGIPETPEKVKESVSVVGELPEAEEVITPSVAAATEEPSVTAVQATPAVRKLARDLMIDITTVKGTGPGGRVVEQDLRDMALEKAPIEAGQQPRMVAKFDLYGWIDRAPLRGIRRSTAKHMIEAQIKAAQVTSMDTADVTELVALREKLKKFAEETRGVKLTYLPFIVKALVAALKKHPYLNASMDEDNDEIILKKYYNIGIAVATEDGLIVPIIKNADEKDIFNLAKEIADLADAARKRSIDLADLKGGTFSITNYGIFGTTYATPIANYPEVAILGTGKIEDVPTVIEGNIVVRKLLYLSLTFDHRVLDGAEAAAFMNDLKAFLENPELALLNP